jgi:hypothetical protein
MTDTILTKPYNHNLGGNTALYESKQTGGKRWHKKTTAKQWHKKKTTKRWHKKNTAKRWHRR